MKPTIIIDAGHGGLDKGAAYDNRVEKDDNLRLALAVGERLTADGFPVFYIRTEDVYQEPVKKAQIANASGGDYAVSFHRNAASTPNLYNGVQTLVFSEDSEAGRLAQAVNDNMVLVGFDDLGVEERKDLAFLRRTKMPAILIEAGFIDSDRDNELFDNEFNNLVNAIVRGIETTVKENDSAPGRNIKKYGVQVGLYRRFENAQYVLVNLLSQGYDAQIIEKKPYFAVIVGESQDLDGIRTTEMELKREGYDTLIVTI